MSLKTIKYEGKEVPADGTGVVELDPWLGPFKDDLRRRFTRADEWITKLNAHEGGLEKFSRVYYPIKLSISSSYTNVFFVD